MTSGRTRISPPASKVEPEGQELDRSTWSRKSPNARQAEIFLAARSVFAEHGYSGTSMTMIGREAGVTPALVNHYFGSKQDLYLAVVDQSVENLTRVVRTDLRHLPPDERIASNIAEFLDSIERDRADWAMLFGARAQADPRLIGRIERVREETIERMLSNQSGIVDADNEKRLAIRVFQGTAEAAALEWVAGRASREQIEALLVTNLKSLLSVGPDTSE